VKDYRLILTFDGETSKKNIEGDFFPSDGKWAIDDYEKGIELLKFGERWFRECIAREKNKSAQIKKEIDTLTQS
jgi:hypothetical protein